MGKIEISALIKAIQESVSLLVSDGIAPRERITDPVNDSARVQDLESGYSTEIDDIVDNIPDVPPTPPAPTLPTYAYPQSGGEAGLANAYWSKNSTYTVYDSDGHVMSLNPGYTIMAVYYLYNNTLEKYDDEYAFKFAFSYSDSYLKAYQANSTAYNVAKIEYKDLPTEKAYLDQHSHSANWSFPYNTNTLLYADDGSYIPYDSNKRYVMSCASKADGTLVYAKLIPVNMDGYLGYRVSTTAQACYIYYTMS